MAILPKAYKPDNFESHNPLKLSFMNIWGLHSNFVDCKSSLESNSPDTLALCQTNLDDSIDSGHFSVRGYLPLIWKDSCTHMHSLTFYMKKGLPFPQDLSLEKPSYSYLCFQLALYFTQCLTSFSSINHFFIFVLGFLFYFIDIFHISFLFHRSISNIDVVLLINPPAVFVFGDFNIHHKDWLIYSSGTTWPGELCYNLRWPYSDG